MILKDEFKSSRQSTVKFKVIQFYFHLVIFRNEFTGIDFSDFILIFSKILNPFKVLNKVLRLRVYHEAQ